jgi:aminopeptidase YwaD
MFRNRLISILLIILLISVFTLFLSCNPTDSDSGDSGDSGDGGDGGETDLDDLVAAAKDSISTGELVDMLYYLASDALEGRLTGEPGNELAAQYIADEFEEYGLEKAFPDSYLQEFSGNSMYIGNYTTNNIIGVLPGNDPVLKDEVIVIGAHMDHIGYNMSPTGSPDNPDELCNGADDNASGTVAVLELADAFSYLRNYINRTFVFIAFSAEEIGLFGSEHYVDNPIYPIGNHIYMLNLDMVGWVKNQTEIDAYGGVTSNAVNGYIDALDDDYPFDFRTEKGSAWTRSDHYNFYSAGMPTVFFHTGLGSPYHQPGDESHLIDYDGLDKVTEFAFELLWMIDREPTAPTLDN